MLNKLTVKNFALIENATITFGEGFSVITGETGSGKSILLGALRLILGERADHSVIRDADQKTVVEAFFTLPDKKLKSIFEAFDLDFEYETIIRREIRANGKSRAFVNDTPVQLANLKKIAELLVYIHSQHHTLELKNTDFQRMMLDVIGEISPKVNEYRRAFREWKSHQKELEQLKERQAKSELNKEFNEFQLEELAQLKLDENDFAAIEREVNRAEEFEELQRGYQMIAEVVNGEGGLTERLGQLRKSITVNDEKLNELLDRISSVSIELDDIGSVADDDLADLDNDDQRIDELVSALDAFNTALRKHGKQTQQELTELFVALQEEVDVDSTLANDISALETQISKERATLKKQAEEISGLRKNSARRIESDIIDLLAELKLANASLEFEISETDLNEYGKDSITLYFQPNKGMAKQRLEKSASGGELSRLMLVIQYLLSSKQELPTLIFDEIDTGVSGEVATKIGAHMAKMGQHMQLIAITHLPQVASKGNHHIRVFKTEANDQTNTYLKELNKQERVEEIAKLMSGEKVNDAALQNALNLMEE